MTTTPNARAMQSDKLQLRLQQVLSRLPYSGLMHVATSDMTGEQLCDHLESFAEVLRRVAERHDECESELRTLRAQRNAMRAFLGTGGAQ